MKIKETIERDCCDPNKDLRTIPDGHPLHRKNDVKFCVYCGTRWEWVRKPGELDYGWEKITGEY